MTQSRTFEAVRVDDSMEIHEKVDRLVRLHMRDHSDLDYRQAARAVFSADRALHRQYLDSVPPQRVTVGVHDNA